MHPPKHPHTRPGDGERGQILVLFAGGVFALLVVAALAFDVGMMLVERRDQQNAADAASLAGARYVLESGDYHGSCDGAPSDNKAVKAACDVAVDNDFDAATDDEDVTVHIPPIHGRYKFPGFIEVQIESTRPSVFGGIIGRAAWPVGVFAAAGNQSNLTFPFAMLALNETMCKAMQFGGGGVIYAESNIHSNSTGSGCTGDPPISISVDGNVDVTVEADGTCRAVGYIDQPQGQATLDCVQAPYSFMLPDPLRFLPAPDQPLLPTPAMVPVGHTEAIPDYCPGATGSKAPSTTNPRQCRIGVGGAYADLAWILHPGLYPGGIEVTGASTVYLMPGIYWIGGGGIQAKNDASIITIGVEGDATPLPADATWGGGVMIYNSKLPSAAGGPIDLNGGGATVKLEALNAPDEDDPLHIFDNIVIFQDRTVTTTVTLNGSASETIVTGIIYVPEGGVKLNGANQELLEGEYSLTVDQIIADNYSIMGNQGSIHVTRTAGVDAVITGVGLVD